jgi:hypothetical protein
MYGVEDCGVNGTIDYESEIAWYRLELAELNGDLHGGLLGRAEQETCREMIAKVERQILELEEAISLPQPDAITR